MQKQDVEKKSMGKKTYTVHFAGALIFLSVLIFLPILKSSFLLPKLLLISFLPVVFTIKRVTFRSILIFFAALVFFAVNPSWCGFFCLVQVLLFLLISESSFNTDILYRWLRVSIFLVSLYAVLQFFKIDFSFWEFDWSGKRVFSTMGNPNELAVVLTMGFLAEMFFFKKRNYFFLFVSGIALLMTFSKIMIAITLLSILISLIKKSILRRIIFYTAIILGFFLVITVAHPLNTRRTVIRTGLKTVIENPFGTGLGRFPSAYKKNLAAVSKEKGLYSTSKFLVRRAHSEIIHMGVEGGFIGIFLFLIVFISLSEYLLGQATSRSAPLLAFLISLIFDFPLHQPIAVLIFILLFYPFKYKIRSIALPGSIKWALLLIPISINIIQFTGELGNHQIFYKRYLEFNAKSVESYKKGDYEQAIKYIDSALDEDLYPELLNLKAEILLQRGKKSEAEELLLFSKYLVPELKHTRKMLLKYYRFENRWQQISDELEELVKYDPSAENFFSLAIAKFRTGEYGEGKGLLRKPIYTTENIAVINILLGNYEAARTYGELSDRRKEIEEIISLRNSPFGFGKKRFDKISALVRIEKDRKYLLLKDLYSPFPPFLKDSEENIFNPLYYLFNFDTKIAEKENIVVLAEYFSSYSYLKGPLYTIWNLPYRIDPDCTSSFASMILEGEFSEYPYLKYLINPSESSAFKELYEKIMKSSIIEPCRFALRHNKLYGNTYSVLGEGFIRDLRSVGLFFPELFPFLLKEEKRLNQDEKDLIRTTIEMYTKKYIDKDWGPADSLKIYNEFASAKTLVMEDYFRYLFTYYDFNDQGSSLPDITIEDRSNYPLLYRILWDEK